MNFTGPFPRLGALLFCASVALAQGVDNKNGVFQLEGNAASDTSICFKPSTGTGSSITNPDLIAPVPAGGCPAGFTQVNFGTSNDWGSLGAKKASSFVTDLTNSQSDSSFTGGSTKDIFDFNQWLWKGAKASQAKDDIAHAFAAAYVMPGSGHTIIVTGLDRYDGSGAATAGFWFLQDGSIKLNNNKSGGADGGFDGAHVVGDLLIVSDFSTGGAVSNIAVYKWVGGANPLQAVTGDVIVGGNATCDPTTGTKTLCGISNPVSATAQWAFLNKSGTPGNGYLQGEFLEIGIDLNVAFPEGVPCFSTFLAETRVSNSTNSILSDFSGPNSFPLCGIAITKSCPAGRVNTAGTGFQYDYNGTVTNIGSATLTNVTITDTLPANATNKNPNPPTFTFASLGPNECKRWPGGGACDQPATQFAQFESVTNGPPNSASVVATTPQGTQLNAASDDDPSVEGNQPATCPTVQVSPALSVEKFCDQSCLNAGSTGNVVRVNFHGAVCNISNVQLTGVQVTDVPDGTVLANSNIVTFTTAGFTGTLGPTGSATACANFTGSYVPTSPLNASGFWTDHVRATGISPLGGTVTPQDSATKSCSPCPTGVCPP